MAFIRKYSSKDTEDVAAIIRKTCLKYNFNEGSKIAVQAYVDRFDPKKVGIKSVRERFESTDIFFVAIENGKIVGMVRGVKGRLVNLYVDGKMHKQGIGKNLMSKFEKEAFENRDAINLKSSLLAVPFYAKMGYKKSTGRRNMRGVLVQPMKKKKIANDSNK